jgi:prevent-host-death family protein
LCFWGSPTGILVQIPGTKRWPHGTSCPATIRVLFQADCSPGSQTNLPQKRNQGIIGSKCKTSGKLSSKKALLKPNFVRYYVQNSIRTGGLMQRLKINQDIKPLSEIRTGIANFIKQVHDTKRPVIITQHGKGVAVLLDVHEYELMQEKLELLSDIQTSLIQIENGKGVTHEEAKNSVLRRGRK